MFLLAFPLLVLAMLAIGLRCLTLLKVPTRDVLERLWFAGVAGLLVMGTAFTLAGLAQMLNMAACWMLVLGGILSGGAELRHVWNREAWRAVGDEWNADNLTQTVKWLLVPLGLWLLYYGFLAIAPNTSWDTLAHHFLVPELYLRHGGIFDCQQVQQSYFPSLLQLTYAGAMAIGGEQTASLIGWWWSSWVIVGVIVLGRNLWSWPAGIFAGWVFLAQELYENQLMGGWADAGIALFVLAGLYAPLRWRMTGERTWLMLGGLLMGGALASSKHNALLPWGLAIVALTWCWWRGMRENRDYPGINLPQFVGREGLLAIVQFAALALIAPAIWYARAWLLTGSPVYPLTLWGLFPGPELPVYVESSWIDQSYVRDPLALLKYPFILSFSPSLREGFQGRFPPQWIAMVPFLWVMRPQSPVVRWWSFFLIATLLIMFKIAPKETRYMLYLVPWLALLSGEGLAILETVSKPKYAWLGLAVALAFLPATNRQQDALGPLWKQRVPVILKRESRGQYIARATPITQAISWMNGHLDKDSFIFCLEDRTYRLEIPWTNYYAATERFPQTAEESYTFCWRQGVTHLFLGDGTIIQPQILKNIVDHPVDPDGITRFRLAEVMINMVGDPIPADRHWVAWLTVRRFLQRAGVEITTDSDGIETFAVSHEALLANPVQRAHYNVMGAMTEMAQRGWMTLVYSDGLNMVWEFNYKPIAAYEDPTHFGIGRPAWTKQP
ncbi:MAG: hypothetical protein ABI743_09330 [bacterium]